MVHTVSSAALMIIKDDQKSPSRKCQRLSRISLMPNVLFVKSNFWSSSIRRTSSTWSMCWNLRHPLAMKTSTLWPNLWKQICIVSFIRDRNWLMNIFSTLCTNCSRELSTCIQLILSTEIWSLQMYSWIKIASSRYVISVSHVAMKKRKYRRVSLSTLWLAGIEHPKLFLMPLTTPKHLMSGRLVASLLNY